MAIDSLVQRRMRRREQRRIYAYAYPPDDFPSWRHRLFRATHTRKAHFLTLALILFSIVVNLASLLLSLFACERGIQDSEGVRTASEALRWAAVTLTAVMLLELCARAVAVGLARFLRSPLHLLDLLLLLALLVVESSVSSRQAQEAVELLIAVRLLRMAKLLGGIRSMEKEAEEAQTQTC